MTFDVEAALKDGVTVGEIVDYLGQKNNFDVAAARRDGVPDEEMLDHLMKKGQPKSVDQRAKDFAERNPIVRGLQGPTGFAESLGRGFYNFVVPNFLGGLAGGAAAVADAVEDPKRVFSEGPNMDRVRKNIEGARDHFMVDPIQDASAAWDQPLGHAFEVAKSVFSGANAADMTYDPNAPAGSMKADFRNEAKSIAQGDIFFDAINLAIMGKGSKKAKDAAAKKRADKLTEETRRQQQVESLKQSDTSAYDAELSAIENTMMRYPQDYQAPQLGLGGRPAGSQNAQGRGRPYQSPTERQAAYDADLARTAAEQEAARGTVEFTPQSQVLTKDGLVPYTGGQLPLDQRASIVTPNEGPAIARGASPTIEFPPRETPRVADMPLERSLVPKEDLATQPTGGPMAVPGKDGRGSSFIPSKLVDEGKVNPIEASIRETAVEEFHRSPEGQLYTHKIEQAAIRVKELEGQLDSLVAARQANKDLNNPRVRSTKHREANVERVTQKLADAKKHYNAMTEIAKVAEEQAVARVMKGSTIERPGRAGPETVELPSKTPPKGRGRRQGGYIDPQIISDGVSKLLGKMSVKKVFDKFKGTFNAEELKYAWNDANDPKARSTLVWMTPDEFHSVAANRSQGGVGPISLDKRAAIRGYVETEAGLNSIPLLIIDETGQVVGHEGRHRMDILKERGVDKVPVIVRSQTHRWGEHPVSERPTTLKEEVNTYAPHRGNEIPFPQMLVDPHPSVKLPAGPLRSQMGAVGDLGKATNTGLASLVRKALTRSKKAEAPAPKAASSETSKVADLAKPVPDWSPELRESMKDAGDFGANKVIFKVGDTLTNSSFINHFTQHPFTQWVLRKVQDIAKTNEALGARLKDGGKFQIVGRGLSMRHIVDPNSPKGLWDSMTKGERADLAALANEFGGKRELTRAEIEGIGMSSKVAKAYEVFRKSYKTTLDAINRARIERGFAPFSELPGYFSRYRSGDYKLTVTDINTGERVWVDLYSNKLSRNWELRELKKQFPESQYKIEASDVSPETRGNPYNTHTIPFEELMHTLDKADPRRNAIESAIADIRKRRGFGRHAIMRNFIGGGELTPKTFYKAFEHYIDGAMQYKSGLELQEAFKKVDMDRDFNAPRAKQWFADVVDYSRGAGKQDAVTTLVEKIGSALGVGASFGNRVTHGANSIFMAKVLFFWRPPFLASQALQPGAFAPQWMAHYQTQGYKGSIVKAMWGGEKALLTKDPVFYDMVENYLAPRGVINPSMVHAMDLFQGSNANAVRYARWIDGQAPAQGIETWGRLQTASWAYAFFKDSGLKGKELAQHVERMVNDVMVDYHRGEAPRWIQKMGITGRAMGPLTTFATNYFATTALFFKDILQNPTKVGSYKPMGIHLMSGLMFGGMLGLIGVKDVDAIITLYNFLTDSRMPTLSERIQSDTSLADMIKELMPNSMPVATIDEALKYGLPSQVLKPFGGPSVNVGASMAAPEFHLIPGGGDPKKMFPGWALLSEFASNSYDVLKYGTNADKRRLYKTVTPNYIDSLVEAHIASEEALFHSPYKRGMAKGEVTEDRITARMLGTKTVEEVREGDAVRAAKADADHVNKMKVRLVEQAADAITTDTSDVRMDDVIAKAAELGYEPRQFIRAVEKLIEARNIAEQQRLLGKRPSAAAMQKLEVMQRYQPEYQAGQ